MCLGLDQQAGPIVAPLAVPLAENAVNNLVVGADGAGGALVLWHDRDSNDRFEVYSHFDGSAFTPGARLDLGSHQPREQALYVAVDGSAVLLSTDDEAQVHTFDGASWSGPTLAFGSSPRDDLGAVAVGASVLLIGTDTDGSGDVVVDLTAL